MLTAMIKRRPPTVPDTVPAWMQQLLKQCLEFDSTKRPSVPSLLEASEETKCYIVKKLSTSNNVNVETQDVGTSCSPVR